MQLISHLMADYSIGGADDIYICSDDIYIYIYIYIYNILIFLVLTML